jgi:hypothetical protein
LTGTAFANDCRRLLLLVLLLPSFRESGIDGEDEMTFGTSTTIKGTPS